MKWVSYSFGLAELHYLHSWRYFLNYNSSCYFLLFIAVFFKHFILFFTSSFSLWQNELSLSDNFKNSFNDLLIRWFLNTSKPFMSNFLLETAWRPRIISSTLKMMRHWGNFVSNWTDVYFHMYTVHLYIEYCKCVYSVKLCIQMFT